MDFFVEKEKGILGASPDGLVTDPSHRSSHGIIGAKNVTVKDGETLKDALLRKSICKMSDNVLKVNMSHMYSRTSIIRTSIIRTFRLSRLFLWSRFIHEY